MADRGTKRKCPSCGVSYYDLNRMPIICPKCSTLYVAAAPTRSAPSRGRTPPPRPVAVEAEPEADEAEAPAEEAADEFEEAEELPSDDEDFGAAEENDERE